MIKFLFIVLVIILLLMLFRYIVSSLATPLDVRPVKRHKSPHEILGVRPDASIDEIKEAFRERVKMYHPDNVPAHLAPELRQLAEERTKEINEAYHTLLAWKGK